MASRNDADGRYLARAFWHGHSGSMSSARGRTKKYTNQRNQGCEKEKKVMIVAPQLDSADSLFTAQYAALIDPPSCFFFCFFSERLNIYRDAWIDIPFSGFNRFELIVFELPVFRFLGGCAIYIPRIPRSLVDKQSTKPRDKNNPTTIACDISPNRTPSYITTLRG